MAEEDCESLTIEDLATTPDPPDARSGDTFPAQFLIIGVIAAIDAARQTLRLGRTEIVADATTSLAGFQAGMRVEVLGIVRDGRHVASRVTVSE